MERENRKSTETPLFHSYLLKEISQSNHATVNLVITQPGGCICILLLFLKLR